jgi:glycosyltransferase involved in cell wall biosynthesis
MKVLYVSHTGALGGAEACLLDLLTQLPEPLEAVLASPTGPLSRQAATQGIRVQPLPAVTGGFRLGVRQTPATLGQIVRAALSLRGIMRRERPALVHANTTRAGLVCAAAGTARLAPMIVHCHDVLPDSRAGRIVMATLARNADLILVISEHVRSPWDGSNVPVEVIYNPLDVARFDPDRMSRAQARATLGLDPDDMLLGVVAQLTPWKGQDTAIQAVATLSERFPNLRLLLVGETKFTGAQTGFDNVSYADELSALSRRLGVEERVAFWGERTDTEVVMRALDVALAPSWEEPFGRSITEAAALATPVVATAVGGPSEYLTDHVTARLIDPQDVHGWVVAVGELLADPAGSAAMASRASNEIRTRFRADAYADRVHVIYCDLVGP